MHILEATAQEVYDTFFKKKLTKTEFTQLLQMDPTAVIGESLELSAKGNFTDWLIRQYLKKSEEGKQRFLTEDAKGITAGLTTFKTLLKTKDGQLRLQQFVTKQNKEITNIKDINQYSVELISLLGAFFAKTLQSLEVTKDKQIDVIINDSVMFACIPKTHEAARKYGTGTHWYTATSNPLYFKNYTANGPLIIIIDKTSNYEIKWQYHHAYRQFENQAKQPVAKKDFIQYWYSKGEAGAEAVSALVDYLYKTLGYKEWNFEKIFSKYSDSLSSVLDKLVGEAQGDIKNFLYPYRLGSPQEDLYKLYKGPKGAPLSFLGVLLSGCRYSSTKTSILELIAYYKNRYKLSFKKEDMILIKEAPHIMALLFEYAPELLPSFIYDIYQEKPINPYSLILLFSHPAFEGLLASLIEIVKKYSFNERVHFTKSLLSNKVIIAIKNTYMSDSTTADDSDIQGIQHIDRYLTVYLSEVFPEFQKKGILSLQDTILTEARSLPKTEEITPELIHNILQAKKSDKKIAHLSPKDQQIYAFVIYLLDALKRISYKITGVIYFLQEVLYGKSKIASPYNKYDIIIIRFLKGEITSKWDYGHFEAIQEDLKNNITNPEVFSYILNRILDYVKMPIIEEIINEITATGGPFLEEITKSSEITPHQVKIGDQIAKKVFSNLSALERTSKVAYVHFQVLQFIGNFLYAVDTSFKKDILFNIKELSYGKDILPGVYVNEPPKLSKIKLSAKNKQKIKQLKNSLIIVFNVQIILSIFNKYKELSTLETSTLIIYLRKFIQDYLSPASSTYSTFNCFNCYEPFGYKENSVGIAILQFIKHWLMDIKQKLIQEKEERPWYPKIAEMLQEIEEILQKINETLPTKEGAL